MAAQQEASPAFYSHIMKTTKRGRPFLKDTLDLFATLAVSLELQTNRQSSGNFPNSFSTDDATRNLAQLKFSQSNRGPDPQEPSRIVTTTTTTTFSVTREMAKAICQHFMDARLIENAAKPSLNLFKDLGVYVLTPKGLHVLERFMSENGINGDPLSHVFTSQPICMNLLHPQRKSVDDEIIYSDGVVTALFRRFAGGVPNYHPDNCDRLDPFQKYRVRSKGIRLLDVRERATGGRLAITHRCCFPSISALDWLCDFTSIIGREEAAEMAAHFVRHGLITLVSDKRKKSDTAIIFTVRVAAAGGPNSTIAQHGEFRCTAKAVYTITDKGRRLAWWHHYEGSPNSLVTSPNSSVTGFTVSSVWSSEETAEDLGEVQDHVGLNCCICQTENMINCIKKVHKESNTERLKYIIEEPQLRTLFREFLHANFCEENLSFYLDVEDLKRMFNITSSTGNLKVIPGQAATSIERHHESLIQIRTFVIYNTFLSPSGKLELSIDNGPRNELSKYLNDVITSLTGKAFLGGVEMEQANVFTASHLHTIIRLYERIQTNIFHLMAMDAVPRFVRSPRFQATRIELHDNEDASIVKYPLTAYACTPEARLSPIMDKEVGRLYSTVSYGAKPPNVARYHPPLFRFGEHVIPLPRADRKKYAETTLGLLYLVE